jgi:hypothetical protein
VSSGPGAGSTPAGRVDCSTGDLEVTARVDDDEVPAGEPVPVVVEVRSRGSEPCGLRVDASSFRVHITSGSDLIWDTADCPSVVPETRLTLDGETPSRLTVTWPGARSSEGCPTDTPKALPGYYAAHASVGGVTSAAERFRLVASAS